MTANSIVSGDCTEPCTTIWTTPGGPCTRTGGSHRCAHLHPDHQSEHRCACEATTPRRDTHPGH